MAVDGERLMTKTQHYRKVTKPLLERKRRARMNLYLDELKEIIVDTLEAEGENITKLEKADILEMTVNYLKSHKKPVRPSCLKDTNDMSSSSNALPNKNAINIEKFRAGYTQATHEVSKIIANIPTVNSKFATHLMRQLGYQFQDIELLFFDTKDMNLECLKSLNFYNFNMYKSRPTIWNVVMQPTKKDVWRPW